MGSELTDADSFWGEGPTGPAEGEAPEPVEEAEPARSTETTGVLVMAYGTPATPDDVEAYYTHVRRGRPPTPELLDDLRARYEAIGGT